MYNLSHLKPVLNFNLCLVCKLRAGLAYKTCRDVTQQTVLIQYETRLRTHTESPVTGKQGRPSGWHGGELERGVLSWTTWARLWHSLSGDCSGVPTCPPSTWTSSPQGSSALIHFRAHPPTLTSSPELSWGMQTATPACIPHTPCDSGEKSMRENKGKSKGDRKKAQQGSSPE